MKSALSVNAGKNVHRTGRVINTFYNTLWKNCWKLCKLVFQDLNSFISSPISMSMAELDPISFSMVFREFRMVV